MVLQFANQGSNEPYAKWKLARSKVALLVQCARAFQVDARQMEERGFRRHCNYLKRLQLGVALNGATGRSLLHSRVEDAAKNAKDLISKGRVVHTVQDVQELDSIQMWRQGDADLATADNVRKRFMLRHTPEIHKVHAAFWDVMMRSNGRRRDDFGAKLNRDDYFALFERVYVVLLDNFDKHDAEKTISEDWENDCKGQDGLSYEAFGDCLFELADTWVSSIDAGDYAAFLYSLLKNLTDGGLDLKLKEVSSCRFESSLAPEHDALDSKWMEEGDDVKVEKSDGDEDGRSGNDHDAIGESDGRSGDHQSGDHQNGDGRSGDDRTGNGLSNAVKCDGESGDDDPGRGGDGSIMVVSKRSKLGEEAKQRHRAATKIQAQKRSMEAQEEGKKRSEASTRIQAGQRGWKVRQGRREAEADDHGSFRKRGEKWNGDGSAKRSHTNENLAFGSTLNRETSAMGPQGSGADCYYSPVDSWGAKASSASAWGSGPNLPRPYSAAHLTPTAGYSPSMMKRPSTSRDRSRPSTTLESSESSQGSATYHAPSSGDIHSPNANHDFGSLHGLNSSDVLDDLSMLRAVTLGSVSAPDLHRSVLALREELGTGQNVEELRHKGSYLASFNEVNLFSSLASPFQLQPASESSPAQRRARRSPSSPSIGSPSRLPRIVRTTHTATAVSPARRTPVDRPARRSLVFEQAIPRRPQVPRPVHSFPVATSGMIGAMTSHRANGSTHFELRGHSYSHKSTSREALVSSAANVSPAKRLPRNAAEYLVYFREAYYAT